jgi:hypothetical protein
MKLLSEKFIQKSIIEHLFQKGWSRDLRAKESHEHGVDIKVRHHRYARYWLIECKGDASKTAKSPRANREVCFTLGLGQIITRMKSDGKRGYKYGYKYGVGYPEWFRDPVIRRLPYNVADKLNLYVFLVAEDGSVDILDWKELKNLQTVDKSRV